MPDISSKLMRFNNRAVTCFIFCLFIMGLTACNDESYQRDLVVFSEKKPPFEYLPQISVKSSSVSEKEPMVFSGATGCYEQCFKLPASDYQVKIGNNKEDLYHHPLSDPLSINTIVDADSTTIDSSFSFNAVASDNYVFELCVNSSKLATINSYIDPKCFAYPEDIYLRGSFNNWDANANSIFTFAQDNVYSRLIYLDSSATQRLADGTTGMYEFKISTILWSDSYTFSKGIDIPQEVKLNTSERLYTANGTNNNSLIRIDKAGTYQFELTVGDTPSSPSLRVSFLSTSDLSAGETNQDDTTDVSQIFPDLFVRSSFGSWGHSEKNQFKYVGDNTYELIMEMKSSLDHLPPSGLEGYYEFKISDQNWSNEFTFTQAQEGYSILELDTTEHLIRASGEDNNMLVLVPDDGDYKFTLTFKKNELTPILFIEKYEPEVVEDETPTEEDSETDSQADTGDEAVVDENTSESETEDNSNTDTEPSDNQTSTEETSETTEETPAEEQTPSP